MIFNIPYAIIAMAINCNQKAKLNIMNNLKLTELDQFELLEISGGSRWKRLKDLGKKAWDTIAATDAYLSFKEGWDSVECE